jgi:hypothetical protein
LATDSSPLRIAPPAEQLLRRQTISPCDSRDFVPALIALCENRRLLLRRPRAPSARSGEDLKPSNRLTLRLVQKLSVRHVSNPLPTQTTSDNRPLANALEGAIKGPLTHHAGGLIAIDTTKAAPAATRQDRAGLSLAYAAFPLLPGWSSLRRFGRWLHRAIAQLPIVTRPLRCHQVSACPPTTLAVIRLGLMAKPLVITGSPRVGKTTIF